MKTLLVRSHQHMQPLNKRNQQELKMENCKQLPGWEKYQSKAEQEKQSLEEMGLYDPLKWNPSEQEVSERDRLVSKLDSRQQAEYGQAPMQVPVLAYPSLSGRGKGKGK